jgi:hypothetical protein
MTPFQCDWCLFRLLTSRIPHSTDHRDQLLLCILRRVNLDTFWAREESTVTANRRNLNQLVRLWVDQLGMPAPLPSLGPYPTTDVLGVGVAVAMLLKSRETGHYQDHMQFETIRKLRSAYSNVYHATSQGASAMMTLGRDSAKSFLSTCPTHSLWFERFARGCLKRMGQEVRRDLALSSKVIRELLEILEKEWQTASEVEKHKLALLGAYAAIAFGGSFRGHEVFLTDLFGLIKYGEQELTSPSGTPYVIIPLLGRFKTETGERYHLTPLVATTASGIPIGTWVRRLMVSKKAQGGSHGPAFSDAQGRRISLQWVEMEMLERIQQVQARRPDLMSSDVSVFEQVGISRSFRRGATTEARNQGVSEGDIDAMNRWRNVENAKGRKPRLRMQDHYSDIAMMIPALLHFSAAL